MLASRLFHPARRYHSGPLPKGVISQTRCVGVSIGIQPRILVPTRIIEQS